MSSCSFFTFKGSFKYDMTPLEGRETKTVILVLNGGRSE